MCYLGSGSESHSPASGDSATAADCSPGRCADGCSGCAHHDSASDHHRTSDADYDEGSGTGRPNYAPGANPWDKCANHADHGQSRTTGDTGNAGEWDDVRARASRHSAERTECKCEFVGR